MSDRMRRIGRLARELSFTTGVCVALPLVLFDYLGAVLAIAAAGPGTLA